MSRRNPMPEFTDAPIKLFGRSIHVRDSNSPPSTAAATTAADSDASSSAETAEGYAETGTKESDNGTAAESGKSLDTEDTKNHEQRADKANSDNDEKVLKKPDKILPCPRCHSMETKFCYFNNYNVNQPRHFCKSCQRYWTAGGTIRNVPIGAGRRKNKQIGTQFQPNGGGPITHLNLLNSADQTKEDPPLCNSVATLLTLNDRNKEEPKEVAQIGSSSGSNIAAPLPYPWNLGWTPGHAVLVPWSYPPMVVPPQYWNWQTNNLSPSSSSTGNTSPLGKHSRDLNSQAEEATEKCLWVPKTLRIDDPDVAAKSSIWTTLGIEPDDREPFSKCKPLKELLRKDAEGEQALQANPAAHSRFKAFQETS